MTEYFLPGKWSYLWESIFFVIWVHCQYLLLGGGTEDLDDLDQLVNTALSWKDWLTKHELCDDAANRPDID